MKKLLHERLREWVKKSEKEEHLPTTVAHHDLELDHDSVISEQIALFNYFADEIEHDYIPLPCDPEGKPWKIGDEAISGEGETFIVQGIGYTDGQSYLIHINSGTVYDAQWCKRPQPKVLDADGIPINVGDTVWDRSNKEWRVGEISDSAHIYVYDSDENGDCRIAACLTHKEPDSLEKLLDDMQSKLSMWHNAVEESTVESWADRLSALIERGA